MVKLCSPSLLYLLISSILLIISIFSNFNWKIILFQLLSILLWTWVLNVICNSGYPTISWVLIIIPFVMYLIR